METISSEFSPERDLYLCLCIYIRNRDRMYSNYFEEGDALFTNWGVVSSPELQIYPQSCVDGMASACWACLNPLVGYRGLKEHCSHCRKFRSYQYELDHFSRLLGIHPVWLEYISAKVIVHGHHRNRSNPSEIKADVLLLDTRLTQLSEAFATKQAERAGNSR